MLLEKIKRWILDGFENEMNRLRDENNYLEEQINNVYKQKESLIATGNCLRLQHESETKRATLYFKEIQQLEQERDWLVKKVEKLQTDMLGRI